MEEDNTKRKVNKVILPIDLVRQLEGDYVRRCSSRSNVWPVSTDQDSKKMGRQNLVTLRSYSGLSSDPLKSLLYFPFQGKRNDTQNFWGSSIDVQKCPIFFLQLVQGICPEWTKTYSMPNVGGIVGSAFLVLPLAQEKSRTTWESSKTRPKSTFSPSWHPKCQ